MLEEHLEQLRDLCRHYGVKRLDLFGSALRGGFDPRSSDLDFFVDFGDQPAAGSFRRYMGFKLALEALFGRSVDLVEPRAVTNPYFLEATRQRRVVYAA